MTAQQLSGLARLAGIAALHLMAQVLAALALPRLLRGLLHWIQPPYRRAC